MLNPELILNARIVDRLASNRHVGWLASRWQGVVKMLMERLHPALRDALHGRPFGHSLHITLTDVPIGAWTTAGALDLLSLCGADDLEPGADAALAVGLAAAGGAAATGWADWSDTKDEPRTLGMAHALLMIAATAAYAGSLALRLAKLRRAAICVSATGYGMLAAAAFLGGELSAGLQLGTKHTGVPQAPPDEFTTVARFDDLPEGMTVSCRVGTLALVVVRRGTSVSAFGAACTHRGAPLEGLRVNEGCVVCPWHGSRFNIADGRPQQGPATFPLPLYETRVQGGEVQIRRPRLA